MYRGPILSASHPASGTPTIAVIDRTIDSKEPILARSLFGIKRWKYILSAVNRIPQNNVDASRSIIANAIVCAKKRISVTNKRSIILVKMNVLSLEFFRIREVSRGAITPMAAIADQR